MTIDERFLHLRKLLSVPLTERVMRQLEAAYRQWPDDEEKQLAYDYIDAHLAQWGRAIDEFVEEQDAYDQPTFEASRATMYKSTHGEHRRIDNRKSPYQKAAPRPRKRPKHKGSS